MTHLGDFDTSTVVYGKFTTYRPSTGAAYTLGGTPALSVYKDNSVTQSTTGVTLTADFDSVTGLNHFAIDTSADGTFYAAGSFFSVVITTGTVDSVSVVGAVVAEFTLRKNSALKPTVAARTLDVSAGGEAGVDWANVGSPTTAVGLSGTTISTSQAIASVSGAVGSVTGAVGSVTGAVGSVTGAVTVGTNNDKTGYALSAAGVQAIWDALTSALTTVGSVGKLLVDRIDAAITTRSSHSAADVWSSATRALTDKAGFSLAADQSAVTVGTVNAFAAGSITASVVATGAIDADALANDATAEIADAILDRNMATGTDSGSPTVRTIRQALRALRNKVSIAAGTATITKEDDVTASWTATVTTTAGNPISSIDPA